MYQALSDTNRKTDKYQETFLPFDLEFAFSSVLHLTIAYALFHSDPADYEHIKGAQKIFDRLVSGGNRVAEARRADLTHIQSLFQVFSNRIEEQGVKGLELRDEPVDTYSQRTSVDDEQLTSQTESTGFEWSLVPETDAESFMLAHDPLPQNLDWLETIGISSNEFHSIVDKIGSQDLPHEPEDPPPIWMTRGSI